MGVQFSADEILAVAERIEQNGINFYQTGANLVSDSRCKALLSNLAEREKAHERIFHAMRAELKGDAAGAPSFDPSNEERYYVKAFADAHVFPANDNAATTLGPTPTYKDILLRAINLEKDSIVFYVGLRELVPPAMGDRNVDEILREEMRHLAQLNREVAQLQ